MFVIVVLENRLKCKIGEDLSLLRCLSKKYIGTYVSEKINSNEKCDQINNMECERYIIKYHTCEIHYTLKLDNLNN